MADDRKPMPGELAGDPPPLPADAADVLTGWATGDVPAGFADRVVAATHPAQIRPARRRWSIAAIAAIAAAALAAAAPLAMLRGGRSPEAGARVVRQRESLALGARGVAVAEPGAALSWTIDAGGAAEVHQTRGDVFYRVEKGGPFRVETPYGQVMVRGTCFRVEVLDMKVSKSAWLGGAIGAAAAAIVVIAVYEGGVRVVNASGHADARAGERIALRPGAAPVPLGGDPAPALAALEPPPPDAASVPELLRRDQAHRGEIALLRARLRSLETPATTSAPEPTAPARREGSFKMLDFSHDELVEMATRCEIRFDIPGYGIEPRAATDQFVHDQELSADDRAIYDRLVRAESDRYMTALRALYREATGSDGDNLDAHALSMEVIQKSPRPDVIAARKRIADERAGLAPPAASGQGANQSVIERMLRLQTAAGDALERMLAAELGPDRAHQIRQAGWAGGDSNVMGSCKDE